jgi:hypothetical protein
VPHRDSGTDGGSALAKPTPKNPATAQTTTTLRFQRRSCPASSGWSFDLWARVFALTHRIGEHVQAEALGLVDEVYEDLYAPDPILISIE